MDELKVEIAIDIIQRKIADFIKNNKEQNIKIFKNELQKLSNEEEKIYELDEETIKKVYEVYLADLKRRKNGEI